MGDEIEYVNPIDVYAAGKKREIETREAFDKKVMEAQEKDNRLSGSDWISSEEKRIIAVLVKRRKAARVTQVDVAKRMGSQKAAVSRLESTTRVDRNSPLLSTMIKYAEALGYRLHITLTRTKKES